MAIEAPLSKHSKTNFLIGIVFCVAAAAIFAYDGYVSRYEWSLRRSFYEAHTRKLLFRVDGVFDGALDRKTIPEKLRRVFSEAQTPFSDEVVVKVVEPGSEWVLADGTETYLLVADDEGVTLYHEGLDATMLFNRIVPPFFALAGVAYMVWFWMRKDAKVVAEDQELVVSGKKRIPYDAIESIDKTHFEKKGFFTITYQNDSGGQTQCRLDSRQFDNLSPILDHLVAQIT